MPPSPNTAQEEESWVSFGAPARNSQMTRDLKLVVIFKYHFKDLMTVCGLPEQRLLGSGEFSVKVHETLSVGTLA